MNIHTLAGKSIIFHFQDGPMANKAFQHDFGKDGMLRFHPVGAKDGGVPVKYESATLDKDVTLVSYYSPSQYTLTVALNFKTGKLIAVSSNGVGMNKQEGSFETVN